MVGETTKHGSQYKRIFCVYHLKKKSPRAAISVECRLAITLSFLSQGVPPKYLSWSYEIGKSTVREIILETCSIICIVLSPNYVSNPTSDEYQLVAEEFKDKWNLPNCVGAIDGKHVQIQAPPISGSQFFNYKKSFSIVLLAACDARYIFTHVCVGAYGSQSDGGILKESKFGSKLLDGTLTVPPSENLPGSNIRFPHFFVGDAAFPLRTNLMRPYPGRNLTQEKEIYNYRLSRARRIIENSFGILLARWRFLKNSLNMFPENAEKVVLATIALHNFINIKDKGRTYIPPAYADWEDQNHMFHSGEWRREANSLRSVSSCANNAPRTAIELREQLCQYLNNEGSVPFQYNRH